MSKLRCRWFNLEEYPLFFDLCQCETLRVKSKKFLKMPYFMYLCFKRSKIQSFLPAFVQIIRGILIKIFKFFLECVYTQMSLNFF